MVVSTLESLASKRRAPLGIHLELPLTGTYYPLGFRLDLATNSRDVVQAAEESWAGRTREFASAPVVMRVVVHPEGPLSKPGIHRQQGDLYSVVSDRHNSAQA